MEANIFKCRAPDARALRVRAVLGSGCSLSPARTALSLHTRAERAGWLAPATRLLSATLPAVRARIQPSTVQRRSVSEDQMAEPLSRRPARLTSTLSLTLPAARSSYP